MNSKKKKRDRDRPALVEIDNLREKTGEREKQEAERRRYLVSGYTRERVFFFVFNYKRKN